MWTCNLCNRTFNHTHQNHYCGDKTTCDFLAGKSEVSLMLFDKLIERFEKIGPIKLYSTKSMIVIAADVRFAYIINLGKNFLDLVLPFKESFDDNLCFRKIALVPGSGDYNHHLRLMFMEDLNEEVVSYLKKAYANGKAIRFEQL
jgi:hypothetical protein